MGQESTEEKARVDGTEYKVLVPKPGGRVFLFKEIEHPEGGTPRSIAFKDVTVVPRGYEELLATKAEKAVTIELRMFNGVIVDSDIEGADPSKYANITATLVSPFTANSIGLVPGGWLPSILAATVDNSAVLLDRNVVIEIVSRFERGESKGRRADFLDLLKDEEISINPCLYAMEGSLQRIPDDTHVRQEFEQAIARLSRALPKAKLMIGSRSIDGIMGLIEEARPSLERKQRFLQSIAPILQSPIGAQRQNQVWCEVLSIAKGCGVAPTDLVVLAALSAVVTPQSSPARKLLKFQPGYKASLAYNALCDLRALEYLLNCTARYPELRVQLCTADRALALFWTALGAVSRLEKDRLRMEMTPHAALLPPVWLERWNRISTG